jgi:hypothetical protein
LGKLSDVSEAERKGHGGARVVTGFVEDIGVVGVAFELHERGEQRRESAWAVLDLTTSASDRLCERAIAGLR